MISKRIAFVLAASVLVHTAWSQAEFRKDYFRAPIDIEMLLSGNFGELRSNHFHAGIDIKTRGIVGHRIFAAADGYISRIKIESGGYGNTIYITHPAGYTTVYAHLDRFRDDLADWVREQQYSRQSHALNLFPKKDKWKVQKGEMIAFSGTSGYSFGPHLHFEIRDANYQVPMNTLHFGLDIKDDRSPRIFSVYTYPMDSNSFAKGSGTKTRMEVSGKNGDYHLEQGDTLYAGGNIGFGIEAFDYLNGARNRCGIYRIRMYLDGELYYDWTMDRFPFSQARFVNSYIDFEEKARTKKLVQKAFVDPNTGLELYGQVVNNGVAMIHEGKAYKIRFVLEDAYLNTSEIGFTVIGEKASFYGENTDPEHSAIFKWDQANEFSGEGILLKMPEKALYRDLPFRYNSSEPVEGSYSALHKVHDIYTPVHLPYELGLLPENMPEELADNAFIAVIDDEGEAGFAGGEWKDSMLWTETREFGSYTIMVDTTEPEIKSLDLDGSGKQVNRKSIRFKVTDDLSGIKSYEGYIDNEWVLFEYDAKNDLVFYSFDPARLVSGKSHELELYIIDNKENIAYYYAEFYW